MCSDGERPIRRIAVACGGTGGHVFPGVATARVLASLGHDVALLLSGRDVEQPTTSEWKGRVLQVRCPPPRWRRPADALRSLATLLGATTRAGRHFAAFRPDVLLAMGSYTSVGPVLAARLRGIPVLLHEANVIPGVAVRRLAGLADEVAVSFEATRARLPTRTPTVLTGLPVRTDLAGRPPLEPSPQDDVRGGFTVLVMGGSQGARSLNALAVEAFRILAERPPPSQAPTVLHLAGLLEEETVRQAYAKTPVRARVFGFLHDMGGAYAAADLCVSRAGAAACFELCLCGPPPLLVPLAGAAHDHQTANARALEAAGAAELLPQPGLTPEHLARQIEALGQDAERRRRMRDALRSLARPEAAQALADRVLAQADTKRRSGA